MALKLLRHHADGLARNFPPTEVGWSHITPQEALDFVRANYPRFVIKSTEEFAYPRVVGDRQAAKRLAESFATAHAALLRGQVEIVPDTEGAADLICRSCGNGARGKDEPFICGLRGKEVCFR